MEINTKFRDRETDEIRVERVYGQSGLWWLYHSMVGRSLTNLLLRREVISRVHGWLQRRKWSRRRIKAFVEQLGIDPREAERPLDEYATFDDFFTRRLAEGARPVDQDPNHLISPADGRILVYPHVDAAELRVKETNVAVDRLVDDPKLSAGIGEFAAVVVRLAPVDYHRFHFPDSGTASAAHRAGRGLHSVHPIALGAGAPCFDNKRMITRLESDHFGPLLVVDVGALLIGDIIQTFRPGPVRRGQEKGYFRFGGSTVILLADRERLRFDPDLVESSAHGMETFVKWGTRIACRAGESSVLESSTHA